MADVPEIKLPFNNFSYDEVRALLCSIESVDDDVLSRLEAHWQHFKTGIETMGGIVPEVGCPIRACSFGFTLPSTRNISVRIDARQ